MGVPPVLPTEGGHVLTAVDNLNPFWTLYAPSHEEDPRGLIGEVCSAFGLPEPAVGSTVIDGQYLDFCERAVQPRPARCPQAGYALVTPAARSISFGQTWVSGQ